MNTYFVTTSYRGQRLSGYVDAESYEAVVNMFGPGVRVQAEIVL